MRRNDWHAAILLFIFLLHHALERLQCSVLFLDHYLDPFIFGNLMPYILLKEQYFLNKNGRAQRLSWAHVVGISILLMFFSEWVLPRYVKGYYADVWDLLSIALGSIYYWLFLNKYK